MSFPVGGSLFGGPMFGQPLSDVTSQDAYRFDFTNTLGVDPATAFSQGFGVPPLEYSVPNTAGGTEWDIAFAVNHTLVVKPWQTHQYEQQLLSGDVLFVNRRHSTPTKSHSNRAPEIVVALRQFNEVLENSYNKHLDKLQKGIIVRPSVPRLDHSNYEQYVTRTAGTIADMDPTSLRSIMEHWNLVGVMDGESKASHNPNEHGKTGVSRLAVDVAQYGPIETINVWGREVQKGCDLWIVVKRRLVYHQDGTVTWGAFAAFPVATMEDQCPLHLRQYQDFSSGAMLLGDALYLGVVRDPCGKGPDNVEPFIGLRGTQTQAYELCRDTNKLKMVYKVSKNGVIVRP